jgi:predicted homoserine dehydrogenase-like protein
LTSKKVKPGGIMRIYDKLLEREENHNPVRVGLVGCGQMGSGLVHVIQNIMGMETAVIADINVQRPLAVLQSLGIQIDDICITATPGEAEDALNDGKVVVSEDALLLSRLQSVDVVVEATGLTNIGAQVAWACVQNAKHVVMLNVETDVTVGPQISREARSHDCVYTVASGDEPGELFRLYQEAKLIGFDVVCLGKGKNNPIDYNATPESCLDEALSKGMNPKMLAAFKDGTKTMVEMASVSNSTGLIPDVPGMHGPKVEIPDLADIFKPRSAGGIFDHIGCVDYTTGRVAPGIFAIVTTDEPRIQKDMEFVGMGSGPYYSLLRPYHLCNIETPYAIADAAINRTCTAASSQFVSEVLAVAKRDLDPGDILGGIGSTDYLGRIYTHKQAQELKGIPLGLMQNGVVQKLVRKGEVITDDNCIPEKSSFVYKLRYGLI